MNSTPNDTEKYAFLYQQIIQSLDDNEYSDMVGNNPGGSILDDEAYILRAIKVEIEKRIPDIGNYRSIEDCYEKQMLEKIKPKIQDINKFKSQKMYDSQIVKENATLMSVLSASECNYQNFVEGKPGFRFLSSNAMRENASGNLEPDSTKSQSLRRNLVGTAVSGAIGLAAVGVLAASVFFSGGLTLPLIGIALPSLSSVPFLTTAAMIVTPISISLTGFFGSKFYSEKDTDIKLRKQAFQQARKDFLGEKPDLNDLRQDPVYVQEQSRTPKPIQDFLNPLHARTLENKNPSKGAPKVTTNRGRQIAQVFLAVVVIAAVAFLTGGLGLLPVLPLLPAAMSTLATMTTTGLSTLGITGISISANAVAATLGGTAFLGYNTSKYLAMNNESTIQKACKNYVEKIQNIQLERTAKSSDEGEVHVIESKSTQDVHNPQEVRKALEQYLEKNKEIKDKLSAAAEKQYQKQPLHQQILDNKTDLQRFDQTVSTLEKQSPNNLHIHEKVDAILQAQMTQKKLPR